MDRDIERAVAGELLPDETVLWVGRPNPSRLFTKTDWFWVPLTLAAGAFGIWFVLSILHVNVIMILFAIIYIPMIVYMMVGRFFAKAYNKKRTVYAVTNKRVMRLVLGAQGQKRKGISAELTNIETESVSLRRDGCGNLYFGPVPAYSKLFMNTGLEHMPGYHVYDGMAFFDVDNAGEVFETYRNAKTACRPKDPLS